VVDSQSRRRARRSVGSARSSESLSFDIADAALDLSTEAGRNLRSISSSISVLGCSGRRIRLLLIPKLTLDIAAQVEFETEV
jgi:hypothetical protein